MIHKKTLYDETVKISTEFLGPAGERFMRRQISMHLNIEPEKVQAEDLEELVEWIRLTVAVITRDKQHVDDFTNSLLELAPQGAKKRSGRSKVKHGQAH